MLSYNVADLLRAAPGTERRFVVQEVEFEVAPDLRLAAPVAGEIRLSVAGRSILARANLSTAIDAMCSRCLSEVIAPIDFEIDEVALPIVDIDTGKPVEAGDDPDALRLNDHHELDLGGPVREAISLAEPIALLCRPDCRGLCFECGADLNATPEHAHSEDQIDPRLASLAAWRAPSDTN